MVGGEPPGYEALTERERKFYPAELGHAYRLIEAVATRLDGGDEYDQLEARRLRGLARAVAERAVGIARGEDFRRQPSARIRRFFKRRP